MIKIPASWAMASVDDAGDYINGMSFKPSDWSDSGTPIIRIQNLTLPNRKLNRTKITIPDKYIVNAGDILVSWSATLDVFVWAGEQAALNQHIFRVIPKYDLVDREFLFYCLRHVVAEMAAGEHLHGSTMKHINRGPFLAHAFPLPPRAEQKRIAAEVTQLFRRSQTAKNEIERSARLVTTLKSAILREAFCEQGQPNKSLSYYISDGLIGLVRSKEQQSTIGGTPYIRMQHFDIDGSWNNDSLTLVSVTDTEKRRYALRPGDILFNTRNSSELVGKVAIWSGSEKDHVYNNNLLRLRFDNQVIQKFAYLQLQSPTFRSKLESLKSATTSVAAIYQKPLMELPFWVPDRETQRNIVGRVEAAFAAIDRISADVLSTKNNLDKIDQAILAKAFRGELVPQDPNDEPASVLLDRIRAERAAAGPAPKRGRRSREVSV